MADLNVSVVVGAQDLATGPLTQVATQLDAIDTAAAKAGAAAGGFTVNVNRAGEASKAAGEQSEIARGLFQGLGSTIEDVGKIASGFLIGNLIGQTIAGLTEILPDAIKETTSLGEAVFRLQAIIGGTDENASQLLAVFERYGVGADQASTSLGIFEKHIAGIEDATDGALPGSRTFIQSMKDLGVAFTDTQGAALPMSQVLLSVADKFQSLGPGVDRTAIAMQLFGRSGKDLIPVLSLGAAGMQEAEAAASKYGLTLSGTNVQAVRDYGFAHKDLDEAMTGVSLTVGRLLIPALTNVAEGVATNAEALNQRLIPEIQQTGEAWDKYASIVELAQGRIARAQAGIGSNSSETSARRQAEDESIANLQAVGNLMLAGAEDGIPLIGTLRLQTQELNLLGKALGYVDPPFAHLSDTMASVRESAGTVGTTAQNITPPFQHLGDTMAAVSGDAYGMTQSFVASQSAMINAKIAADSLSISFEGIHRGDELTNFSGEGPSSSIARITTNTKDLTTAATEAEAAANKAATSIGSIGQQALASIPGLAAFDAQMFGTSQKLAADNLAIAQTQLARLERRPVSNIYQQQALDQAQLTVDEYQRQVTYGAALNGVGKVPAATSSRARTGFADGGMFTVPGSGAGDSTMVHFMATPGESVSISQSGQGGGAVINFGQGSIVVNTIEQARQAGDNFGAMLADLVRSSGSTSGKAHRQLAGVR